MSSSKPVMPYRHEDWVAGHGDVLKHVVWCAVLRELQQMHPQGLTVTDCMAGDGVYDLNQHTNPAAYQKGILKVLQRFEQETETTPATVQEFCKLVLKVTGCVDQDEFDVYPGSPVLTQRLMRAQDEHRLLDPFVKLVQWMDVGACRSDFQPLDCFDVANSLQFILPYAQGDDSKHPVILIDPDYWEDKEYGQVKSLLTSILDQHPAATVLVWWPLIQNHSQRWSFATTLKELAKKYAATGRYFTSLQIAPLKYQGSALLVCNPPGNLDEVVSDDCLHWLANTMNQGKDEFTVEQFMKKKKRMT